MRTAGRNDAGSVSVLTAGILVVMATLALASVDLLRALDARSRAQAAADAAALAAARELAVPTGADPVVAAQEYAARNGASLAECVCPVGSTSARVTVEIAVDLVFVGGDRTLRASAEAVVGGPGGDHPP